MCRNEEMQLLLSGHLDGCNTPEEEQALQAHLAECADCRQALEDYKKIDGFLCGTRQETPVDFTANVMRAVTAEPRQAAPAARKRRLPFGFATAAAAVAAVLLLAVNAGWLPGLNQGSAKLFSNKSADAAEPAAEAAPMPAAAEEPMEAPEAVAEEASLAPAPKKSVVLPANVDARALADEENCPVGVLFADSAEIPELEGMEALALNGGLQYSLTEDAFYALAGQYADRDLTIYTPMHPDPDAAGNAILIVVTE